jgi:hypothetical protein
LIWRGKTYLVDEKLGEWKDFRRKGRMAYNMRPANKAKALRRGSWGVGRFYFRVRLQGDRIFEIYFDRAPQDADHRLGAWYLDREVKEG